MKKALNKDILRTIWKEKKRFISIMLITTLGVTVMTGLSAGCQDLRASADRFFDTQELFDVSVQSTLGLTDEDVEVLAQLEGVEKAEGSFAEVVHTKKGDLNKTAEVKVIYENGLNLPYVVEGVLPQNAEEIAVTKNYIADTGKMVGDVVEIEELMDEDEEEEDIEVEIEEEEEDIEVEIEEEEEQPNFPNTKFVITGVVIDVMDINNAEGSASFRATPNADYTFFVTPEAVESEVYTAAYLKMEGTEKLLCFSDEYEAKVAALISEIEDRIMEQREQARYDEITGEAYDKIGDAEEEMNEKFAEAEQEFADAEVEISDGWKELEDGRRELSDKEVEVAQEITDARKEIEDGYAQIADAQEELKEAADQLNAGEQQLIEGIRELKKQEEKAEEQFKEAEELLNGKTQENNTLKQEMADGLADVKLLFGEQWTDAIQTDWNALVGAIEVVFSQQMGNATNNSEITDEQMAALMGQITQMSEYKSFAEKIGIAVPVVTNNLTLQKAGLEQQISELEVAIAELEAAKVKLEGEIETLETNKASLTDTEAIEEINFQIAQKQDEIAVKIDSIQEMTATKATIETVIDTLETQLDNMDVAQLMQRLTGLAMGTAQANVTETALNAGWQEFYAQKKYAEEQFSKGWDKIEAGQQELAQGRAQLAKAQKEIDENQKKLDDGVIELNENEQKAQKEFADARQELKDGEIELLDGEEELAENRIEYEEKKADALVKIADAKKEVEDIDMTKWYVQDRSSLSGYSNVDSDSTSIESLASVFCVVFFVVAILISLTTVTRMVEEERGLIGTYKALGFTDREIRKKYVSYAFAASVLGGILGDVGGFVILPEILFIFFDVMYMLPEYYIAFDMLSGIISVILFIVGIAGAAYAACYAELKHLPAHLMRPKSPKMGSRVFLEYITPLWKRMSFLNKVTARNLFRYKKRFFMTVFGIMGCTALLVFGFAIKDSVSELMPMQYENVYKYDLLAAVDTKDNEKLTEYMETHEEVSEYLNIQVETIKLKNAEGAGEKVQMMIFPDGASISGYLTIYDKELAPVSFGEEGIYVTENAAKILELEEGETVAIQKLDLEQRDTVITDIVMNYLGNNVYLTQSAYEKMFGEYTPNGVLANLADTCTDQIAFSDELSEEDWIYSSVSTEELKDGFSAAFTLINIVVYVILILAAGLAFVVLFTLASVNISERIRELATIKVLGFFDREVHSYVNKETLILTGIGILLGLPVGTLLSNTLTDILSLPSIYFAVTIYDKSYLYCAGLSLLFAFLVQIMTDRTLNAIAPAEALKSVE